MYNTYHLQLELFPCEQYPEGVKLVLHEFSTDFDPRRNVYSDTVNPIVVSDNGCCSLTYLALETLGIVFSDLGVLGPRNISRKLKIMTSTSKGYFGFLAIV
jgi:hypothetical protein